MNTNKLARIYTLVSRTTDNTHPVNFRQLAEFLSDEDLLTVIQAVYRGDTFCLLKDKGVHSVEWGSL